MIAAEISNYLSIHGLPPKDPKMKVKLMRGPNA
jgi:hypothetical protein